MSTKKLTLKSDLKIINETLNNNSLIDFDKDKNKHYKNIFSSLEVSTKYSISKRKSKLSIFSGDNKFTNNFPSNRLDAFGNAINKNGNKNYQISFIDQISSEKFAEVILIDSSYSFFRYRKNKEKENVKCSTCFIF
jgi:hypothetical protein